MLKVNAVHYCYPGSERSVLNGVSMAIQPGEFVSLLGMNGCGKSTLFKLIVEDLSPKSGKIARSKGMKLTYISQDPGQNLFLDLTVLENLKLMHVDFSCLKACSDYLASFHSKLPEYMYQPVSMLSGGEKQALILSIKLYQKPDLLLLDEHTSAMDPGAEKRLMDLTAEKIRLSGTTALMCTHKVHLAVDYSQRIVGLFNGEVVLDTQDFSPKYLKQELGKVYGSSDF
jgi:putative tryptophan/tyrosine transport system ATP-binding protein